MTDTFRWRLAIGAVLIAGGYGAWLIVPLVVASNLSPNRRLFAVSLVQFRNFRRKRISKRVALLHLKRRKKNGKPENSFRMQRGKTTSSEVMRRHLALLRPRCEP